MKKRRLLIYFCISLALLTLLGVSFFYLRKLNALEKNSERVDHSYQVIIQTNSLEQKLLNAETSQRSYLLTGNLDFLESYLGELKDIPGIFTVLDRLTADNAEQQTKLDTLKEGINQQVNLLKENMAGRMDTIPLARFRESSMYMAKIRTIIHAIKSSETYLLSEHNYDKNRNSNESRRSSLFSLTVAFVVCCIASVSIIWFFNRNERYRTELEDKLLKLTTLNHEVRELAIASTHNLQEPMRKMQMIIDWLQHIQGINNPQLNEKLNRIKEIYGRQQLVNNRIIDYYDILLSSIHKTNVQLNDFISTLQQKQHWSGFRLQVDALQTVQADKGQLETLFTHLINNALQFRHPARELQIRIRELADEEVAASAPGTNGKHYYGIALSDNGIGLHEEYFLKIFDLFQRVEIQPDNAGQSGMGLSFCKRIMLNHGGWISAHKNEPQGLSILLFFPKNDRMWK